MVSKNRNKRKEFRQSIFFSIFLGVLTVGLIGFLLAANFRINKRRSQLIDQADDLRSQIQVLEKKNVELETGITEAQKDAYWEEKIREQGYQKPGEEPVVVLPPQEAKSEPTEEQKNFWQKVLQKIGL